MGKNGRKRKSIVDGLVVSLLNMRVREFWYFSVACVVFFSCGEESERKAATESGGGSGDSGLPSDMPEGSDDEGSQGGEAGGIDFDDLPPEADLGKLDINDDGPPDTELTYSYIWIANSHEGSVSKINTQTLVEEGRYLTRPDGMGDPSRTSANRRGDVVVANRKGGVTKILADPERCQDANGSGSIESSSSSEFLAWRDEECVAWHTPMEYDSQRAIAWTQGTMDEETLEAMDEKVWVTGVKEGSSIIDIMLLNGDDGTIEQKIEFDYGPYEHNGLIVIPPHKASPWGAYGGAVDRQDNFWFTDLKRDDLNKRPLIRVNFDDFSVDVWEKAQDTFSYGMTVDAYGRAWMCHETVLRFDPETEIWDRAPRNLGVEGVDHAMASGCMVDGEARLWTSVKMKGGGDGIAAINAITLEGLVAFPLPEHPHGISIDFDGFIWGVSAGSGEQFGMGGDKAFRLDPTSGSFETIEGLVGAYTYSDMTGFALTAVIEPPPPPPPD